MTLTLKNNLLILLLVILIVLPFYDFLSLGWACTIKLLRP